MSSLIIDTCGLIWLVNGGGELSKKTLKKIQDAERLRNFLSVNWSSFDTSFRRSHPQAKC